MVIGRGEDFSVDFLGDVAEELLIRRKVREREESRSSISRASKRRSSGHAAAETVTDKREKPIKPAL